MLAESSCKARVGMWGLWRVDKRRLELRRVSVLSTNLHAVIEDRTHAMEDDLAIEHCGITVRYHHAVLRFWRVIHDAVGHLERGLVDGAHLVERLEMVYYSVFPLLW